MTPEDEAAVRKTLEDDATTLGTGLNMVVGFLHQASAELQREGLRLRLTEQRIKTPQRVIAKLDDKGAPPDRLYEEVGDLLGARVIVYNLSDVELLASYITDSTASPLSDTTVQRINDISGYRAAHVNGTVKGEKPVGCEIQIRTALQDAWAVTSREDLYGADPSDDPALAALSKTQADLIHVADDALQKIRDLTNKSATEGVDDPLGESQGPTTLSTEEADGLPEFDPTFVREVVGGLEAADRLILSAPLSEARVEALRSGIATERERSGIREILRAAGAHQRLNEYRAGTMYGIQRLFWKAPLVENTNWVSYSPSQFADALERHLRDQLLDSPTDPAATLSGPPWSEVESWLEQAIAGLHADGGDAQLIGITGTTDPAFGREILKSIDYGAELAVSGQRLRDGGARGTLLGIPVVLASRSGPGPANFHVFDISRFCRHTQTDPSLISSEDLTLHVEDVTVSRALHFLKEFPELLKYETPGGTARTVEEQIVTILRHSRIEVREAGFLEVLDPSFARSVRIAWP